ncbi:MAG: hypothetical protein JMDDDDMK_02618 [Acidobacteria bacterium]|nr:hypothetical protein [Acidobacteriota bacterium]
MPVHRKAAESTEESQKAGKKREMSFCVFPLLLLRALRVFAVNELSAKLQLVSSGLRHYFFSVAIILFIFLPALLSASEPQTSTPRDEAARAKELIKLARAAIGGEEALGRIQTLTASAKYNRFVKYVSVQSSSKVEEKRKALSGKMEFDFALPDKFRRRVTGETLRGFGYSFAQVVSGDQAWRDPPMRPMSSYRDRRVIDVSDVARTEFIQATGAKQELTYFSIGWLMFTLPGYPLEMDYLGVYRVGSEDMHAIGAEGGGGFRFTVLLDMKTYTPAALAISFVENIQETVIVEAPGFLDRRFMQETYARARAERKARAKPPQQYEMLIRFSDRRPVGGALLPFRVTTTLNGELIEEITINEFETNRPINPKRFAGPPESKD